MPDTPQQNVIRDPEEELQATFEARVKPFVESEDSTKVQHYEEAWALARQCLEKVRARNTDHAS